MFQDDSHRMYVGRGSSSEHTSTPPGGDPQLHQTSTKGMPPKSSRQTHHFTKKLRISPSPNLCSLFKFSSLNFRFHATYQCHNFLFLYVRQQSLSAAILIVL